MKIILSSAIAAIALCFALVGCANTDASVLDGKYEIYIEDDISTYRTVLNFSQNCDYSYTTTFYYDSPNDVAQDDSVSEPLTLDEKSGKYLETTVHDGMKYVIDGDEIKITDSGTEQVLSFARSSKNLIIDGHEYVKSA